MRGAYLSCDILSNNAHAFNEKFHYARILNTHSESAYLVKNIQFYPSRETFVAQNHKRMINI